MNNRYLAKVIAFILPLLLFWIPYLLYLHFHYLLNPHTPSIYKNWGHLLWFVLLVTRFINFLSLSKVEDYSALLTWRRIGYNMLVLVLGWVVVGNIRALAEMIRPFQHAMIDHLFLLFFFTLACARLLLLFKPESAKTSA
jgi:hypothetical protein